MDVGERMGSAVEMYRGLTTALELQSSMQVSDIMTTPAVTVAPDTTLHEAIGEMLQHRVGSVVVLDSGPTGILTRSDILRTVYQTGGSLTEQTVYDGMSGDLITTSPTASIKTILKTMEEHGIKKLPVVEEFTLVGIITMTDIAQHLPERVSEVRTTVERKDDWTD